MATTFGLPIGDSYLRNKMQDIIDELGLPDVVFHSLRHTSVTYKLKLSGGDIKAVQGDSGHAQAARIYFENSFIVNNINIVQGKEKIFVSMPSYKTKQVDEQGKPVYQDVCYPVTKDFREKLYNEIISEYEKAKDKSNEKARESAEKHHGNPDKEKDKEATPFR